MLLSISKPESFVRGLGFAGVEGSQVTPSMNILVATDGALAMLEAQKHAGLHLPLLIHYDLPVKKVALWAALLSLI